jgi:hypothetical protein
VHLHFAIRGPLCLLKTGIMTIKNFLAAVSPLLSLSMIYSPANAQQTEWFRKPKDQWPQVALINEVWYNNGERYIHPSFEYAASGFLIDTGKDTLAATVKHVLWIAKAKTMKSVDFKGKLQRWIMHPKGNMKDSVVIDNLINTDSTEILEGPKSTITQRDWLLFTTKFVSPNIKPLKPRFTPVRVGERVTYFGCPYNDKNCVTGESIVVAIEGDRIIFTMPAGANVGGASGSAIVDENGLLIGILGGSSVNKKNNEPALYGISTRYLKKILDKKLPLNVPLNPIDEMLEQEINRNGMKSAVKLFKTLQTDPESRFTYDFTTEKINRLGEKFLKESKPQSAITIFELSLSEYELSATHYHLGNAYLALGNRKKARSSYERAIVLWPENSEAKNALAKLAK